MKKMLQKSILASIILLSSGTFAQTKNEVSESPKTANTYFDILINVMKFSLLLNDKRELRDFWWVAVLLFAQRAGIGLCYYHSNCLVSMETGRGK